MRIIAGTWKGRTIYPPKGNGTRPTTDRVRESLMSTLASLLGSFEGLNVLDAFAGSGALGLEVLSRGAASAVFCERDRAALAALERNLSICGVKSHGVPAGVIKRGDVLARPPLACRAPFDLVLCDPPYALSSADLARFMETLAQAGALSEHAVLTYEHSVAQDVLSVFADSAVSWKPIQTKRYGDTAIDILRKENA